MALNHDTPTRRKLHAASRAIRAHFPPYLPPFLYLADPDRAPLPRQQIMALPDDCGVLFRHFGKTEEIDFIHNIAPVLKDEGRVFLIAADPELALEIGADGVHWPEKRLPEAHNWRGKFNIQTASAHSQRALIDAAQSGMDAALLSPVFPSKSPSAGQPLGVSRFRRMVAQADLPVYALGGLNPNNIGQVSDIAGMAAIEGLT
ncbi:MAG: thiamine phosphate synthase [Pseudomonadota bacterium]